MTSGREVRGSLIRFEWLDMLLCELLQEIRRRSREEGFVGTFGTALRTP